MNIEKIITGNNLSHEDFKLANSGFSESTYISKHYIIKTFINKDIRYLKELFIYQNIKRDYISKLIDYGENETSKYLLLTRGKGTKVFKIWHLIDETQRDKILVRLIEILKDISKIDPSEYIKNIEPRNFNCIIIDEISKFFEKSKKYFDNKLYIHINNFINNNIAYLDDTEFSLCYYDVHFDNILVDDDCNIQAIFDFEDITYAPLHYLLNQWERFSSEPLLFAAEDDEINVKKDDYTQLNPILRREYPEVFISPNLKIKQRLYSLHYDLQLFPKYHHVNQLRQRLYDTVGYKQL